MAQEKIVYRIGIDCGSKTVKAAVLDPDGNLVYKSYLRHLSNISLTLDRTFREMREKIGDISGQITFTGSAGMQISEDLNVPFIQEVVASKAAVKWLNPDTDVVIELGGEDSKILFITGGEELRMNSTCAGGTGGFIDTIAGMLGTNAAGLALQYPSRTAKRPIASRCAVFAQNDVRSILNEGATKGDIAAATFMAVVNQCVSGLACGRKIQGNVVFLGGPLYYLKPLVECFREVLELDEESGVVPKHAHLYVAMGAALNAVGPVRSISDIETMLSKLDLGDDSLLQRLDPLFESEDEYQAFLQAHKQYELPAATMWGYNGPMFFGIDSGSTTMKSVLTDDKGRVLLTFYRRNEGDIISGARYLLRDLFQSLMVGHTAVGPNAYIAKVAVTGYGEDLMRKAFALDCGLVETVAHLKAAQRVMPDVDSVLDIGGQDIKCIRVRDGHIDSISLNEACSSGCGGLLSGMAHNMMMTDYGFSLAGVHAENPVDLGMRCTVFMTSRVRHAQKVGATAGDISAGLAYSVVKNALYRVMSVHDLSELGKNVVVQGGTFKNDAVLRAFEKLFGRQVARTDYPELMGAYGAALYALEHDDGQPSTMLSAFRASTVKADRSSRFCGICGNNCLLSETKISHSIDEACEWNPMIFVQKGIHSMGIDDTDKYRQVSAIFIMGNRCSRPVDEMLQDDSGLGLIDRQYRRLFRIDSIAKGPDAAADPPIAEPADADVPIAEPAAMPAASLPGAGVTVGLPRALTMYEQFPFWQAFFTKLGCRVKLSDKSDAELYRAGMGNVTSESTCYPAKLAHGHVKNLLEKGVDTVFFPLLRNSKESMDCPVICDYANILEMGAIEGDTAGSFIAPRLSNSFCDPDAPAAAEDLESLLACLADAVPGATFADIQTACEAGRAAMAAYFDDIADYVDEARAYVAENGGWGAVLSCRPYHLDPEINHGIPTLLGSYGLTAVTSDAVCAYLRKHSSDGRAAFTDWRIPNRQKAAVEFAADNDWCELVTLYSFGCGIDVCMHEDMRETCKKKGTSFTALKMDDMTDISSTRIRLRSLLAALVERDRLAAEIRCEAVDTAAVAEPTAEPTVISAAEAPSTIFYPNWMPGHMSLVGAALQNAGYRVEPCLRADGVSEGIALANSDVCQTILSAVGQFSLFQEKNPDEPVAMLVPLACTNCCSRGIDVMAASSIDGFAENRTVMSLEDLIAAADAPLREALAKALVAGDVVMQACCRLQAVYPARSFDELSTDLIQRIIGQASAAAAAGFAPDLLAAALEIAQQRLAEAEAALAARTKPEKRIPIAVLGNVSLSLTPKLCNDVFDRIVVEGCEAVPSSLATQAVHSAFSEAKLSDGIRQAHLEAFAADLADLQVRTAAAMADMGLFAASAMSYRTLEAVAERYGLDCGVQPGIGWCSQATMLSLLEADIVDILFVQTFTCLSNHVAGSAMFKQVRKADPRANLAQVEYDTGISQVNQINRIKLLVALAKSRG